MRYVRVEVDISCKNITLNLLKAVASVSFIGVKIWNTISYHIKTAPTLSAFKKTNK